MIKKLCFAYKTQNQIQNIWFQYSYTNAYYNAYLNIQTVADNKWHYVCINLLDGLPSKLPTSNISELILLHVWTNNGYSYFDVVSVRNTLPVGFDGIKTFKIAYLVKS